MLTPEEANARLGEHRVADAEAQQLAAAGKLPEPLRRLAFTLLRRTPDGSEELAYSDYEAASLDAAWNADRLDSRRRQQLFSTLFPALGVWVEAGWQARAGMPYQTGWQRMAFRSRSPEAVIHSRRDWLTHLLRDLQEFPHDIQWLSAWAPHISYSPQHPGVLLAAAIDRWGSEGEAVFQTLLSSACGKHAVGVMGRHTTSALLRANRPEGWEFIEKMLLAAQRQEGLRQEILEGVAFAHPEAYCRMIRLILDHDLLRFSSVIRAVDVWFGFHLESADARAARSVLERVLQFLDARARDQGQGGHPLLDGLLNRFLPRTTGPQRGALEDGDGESAYLALWARAFDEARTAIPAAAKLLRDPQVERRFAGAFLLSRLGLEEARVALVPALDDEDLRVAIVGWDGIASNLGYYDGHPRASPAVASTDCFQRLVRLVDRLPREPRMLEPILWPWLRLEADRGRVAASLLAVIGERPAARLIPYLASFDVYTRASSATHLGVGAESDPQAREALLRLVGDASEHVREKAFEAAVEVGGEQVAWVPSNTILPSSWPAPVPRSMIQSAWAITAWRCSMTITDLSESTSRSNRPRSCATSARCRPEAGSSSA
jgi:hypothetical protein